MKKVKQTVPKVKRDLQKKNERGHGTKKKVAKPGIKLDLADRHAAFVGARFLRQDDLQNAVLVCGLGGFFVNGRGQLDAVGKGAVGVSDVQVEDFFVGVDVDGFLLDSGQFGDDADFVLEVDDVDQGFTFLVDFALLDVAELFDVGFSVGSDAHGEAVDEGLTGLDLETGCFDAVTHVLAHHVLDEFVEGVHVLEHAFEVVVEEGWEASAFGYHAGIPEGVVDIQLL